MTDNTHTCPAANSTDSTNTTSTSSNDFSNNSNNSNTHDNNTDERDNPITAPVREKKEAIKMQQQRIVGGGRGRSGGGEHGGSLSASSSSASSTSRFDGPSVTVEMAEEYLAEPHKGWDSARRELARLEAIVEENEYGLTVITIITISY